jgi:hypothetical protein
MAIQYINVDNVQTRFMQSFVNLTRMNSGLFPALSTVQISRPENTTTTSLTVVQIYDQYALRVTNLSGQSTLLGA